MTRIKFLRSDGALEKGLKNGKPFGAHHYSHFVDAFGIGNVDFVSIGDIYKEMKTGQSAPVYSLNKDLILQKTNRKGLESDILFAGGFDIREGVCPNRSELDDTFGYISNHETKGNIGHLLNSAYATLAEDKRNFVDFYNEGFNVPETHKFDKIDDLKDFISSKEGSSVVKHIFGYEGIGTHLVNKDNMETISGINPNEFIVQPKLSIVSEKRFILFKNEFLGSRIIYNRTTPWDTEKNTDSRTTTYHPTEEELVEPKKLFADRIGAVVGCIDTIQLTDGTERILEYNGAGTGYGYPSGPYDCNKSVAFKLKEDFSR